MAEKEALQMQHQTFKKPDIIPYFYQKHGLSVTSKAKKEGNVVTKVGSRLSSIKSHEV